jgi:hypothetical protein
MRNKAATSKKEVHKSKEMKKYEDLQDILNKVKDTHKQTDKKLEELSEMCTSRNCKD